MTRGRWRPSITMLIAAIVVSPIVVVSAVLVGLSWTSSARISESLGHEVMAGAAQSVATEVRDFLCEAVRVSDRYARRLEAGVLPDPPKQAWERVMLDDLTTTPNVASICYGNAAGDATWLLRGPGRLEVGRGEGGRANGTVEFAIDPATGATRGEPLRTYAYDPRDRPWWSTALGSDGPRWTPIYAWYVGNNAEDVVGAGYVRKVLNPDGSLRGVIVIDVTLGALSDFLRQLDISSRGRAFIVDGDGKLVAASHGRVMDDAGQRNQLPASLIPYRGGGGGGGGGRGGGATIDGAPARTEATELTPYPGIQWRLITALQESELLADAQAVRRKAMVAGSIVALASLSLGVALSRYLSGPVVSMTRHVKKVAAGDFDTRLHLNAAKELAVLSDEINNMAGGLKQRMVLEQSLAVAMQVQQSLLPQKDPSHAKLDVAGRSKYCDNTGGDYFDFVDVSPLSPSTMLIAVGDVMGHGIAAALLMAAARASLRTNILDRPTLGQLMTRINQVLAADNRHSRFMTLALLRIDGDSGAISWASAGHDPAIIYDATADQFRELEGGELPLGLIEDVEYREYRDTESLRDGSVLVVATDGVWETFNERDEQYGKDRLRAVLRGHHGSSAADIATALEADLASFRGGRGYLDDVTFVIVKPLEEHQERLR
jgi:phosphoserine phosphatase RsbU/P